MSRNNNQHDKDDNDFDYAHFNPRELDELDDMQGGRTNMDKTKTRRYDHLEKMMGDPKVERIIIKEYEKHAKGGRIGDLLREADHMRAKGRNGDTDIAYVGPNTRRVLNKLMGGGSVNPMTGKSEYYNLSKMMGGIGKTIGRGVKGAGNMLGGMAKTGEHMLGGVANAGEHMLGGAMNMAGKALPGAALGFMEGGPAGALAGGASSLMASQMGGRQGPQNLGQVGQQFMNSPQGQSMMNSPMAQKMQGMYGQAQNAYNQGKQMYGKGQQFMNSPQGQQMMNSPMAQQMMNSKMGQKAQGMYGKAQNAYNQGNQMVNNARNQGQQMYNQADQGYQNMMNQGNNYNEQWNGQ